MSLTYPTPTTDIEIPCSIRLPDGSLLHRHQVVEEPSTLDDDPIEWVVITLGDEIQLSNPPAWTRRQLVTPEQFVDRGFDPQTATDRYGDIEETMPIHGYPCQS